MQRNNVQDSAPGVRYLRECVGVNPKGLRLLLGAKIPLRLSVHVLRHFPGNFFARQRRPIKHRVLGVPQRLAQPRFQCDAYTRNARILVQKCFGGLKNRRPHQVVPLFKVVDCFYVKGIDGSNVFHLSHGFIESGCCPADCHKPMFALHFLLPLNRLNPQHESNSDKAHQYNPPYSQIQLENEGSSDESVQLLQRIHS